MIRNLIIVSAACAALVATAAGAVPVRAPRVNDKRIDEAAALGDSVVPLLLERLRPVANNDQTRNLAANSRRILAQLDPSHFLEALVELVESGLDGYGITAG